MIPEVCEIACCGTDANVTVYHPQRGAMEVCDLHAKRIRALPKHRFEGGEVLS